MNKVSAPVCAHEADLVSDFCSYSSGIWFSFNGVGQIVGGLVAYGIAVSAKKHPLAIESWKIVFLVFGLFTACLGFLFWFIMPDNQLNARWLSKTDRVLAIARIRGNQQGIGMTTLSTLPHSIMKLTLFPHR